MSERSFTKAKTKTGATYHGIGLVGAAHYDLPRKLENSRQNPLVFDEEKWVA